MQTCMGRGGEGRGGEGRGGEGRGDNQPNDSENIKEIQKDRIALARHKPWLIYFIYFGLL